MTRCSPAASFLAAREVGREVYKISTADSGKEGREKCFGCGLLCVSADQEGGDDREGEDVDLMAISKIPRRRAEKGGWNCSGRDEMR